MGRYAVRVFADPRDLSFCQQWETDDYGEAQTITAAHRRYGALVVTGEANSMDPMPEPPQSEPEEEPVEEAMPEDVTKRCKFPGCQTDIRYTPGPGRKPELCLTHCKRPSRRHPLAVAAAPPSHKKKQPAAFTPRAAKPAKPKLALVSSNGDGLSCRFTLSNEQLVEAVAAYMRRRVPNLDVQHVNQADDGHSYELICTLHADVEEPDEEEDDSGMQALND